MKKSKLHTVNRWNQPAFMSQEKNLFSGLFGSSQMNQPLKFTGFTPEAQVAIDKNIAASLPKAGGLLGNIGDKIGGVMGGGSLAGSPMGGIIGGLGTAVGGLANNLISGGLSSGAGNAVSSIGGTVGSMVSNVNPVLGGIISAGSGIIGGGINALFGESVDEEALKAANEGTAAYNNFTSNAGSFDDITGPEAQANVKDVYRGGLFNDVSDKNEALKQERKDARSWAFRSVDNNIFNLQQDQMNNALANYSAFGGPIETGDIGAIDYGFMSNDLTMKKKQAEQKNNTSNLFAGKSSRLFDDGGYMTEQEAEKAAADSFHNNVIWNSNLPFGLKGYSTLGKETFNSMLGNIQQLATPYAFGGDMQTNISDFPTGLTHINAGGTHEESPYDGVQMGVDPEGTPNLVEEGETVYNDYVFSNRILADEATKQMFKLPKKRDITFADISKKLEKEIAERPNDPISDAGFKAQMQQLEEQQERQKQEMEAERAKAAFEALSPEEQTALMQQRAEQEAMTQQAAMQEAAAQQQPTPEELAIAQQQMQQADGSVAALGQEPEDLTMLQQNVSALGGELVKASDVEPNRFDYGGKKGSRKARRVARKYDEQWFKNMAKSLGISDKEMERFVYNAEDPEANLVAFNNIYRDNQYNKSKDIYRKGQRQSKRNELFGDRGLYSYSDDKSKIYKARTNNVDRTGWINKDYTGAVDAEGKMSGFLSQEEYDKLKPEEKEAYKRINERAGDRMYDYNGRVIKDLYNGTEDELLNSFDTDYDKGFKWDDKDAQTLQYPVDMEHSTASYMRYIPALGGAIGLANDLFSSPDYSSADAIINASRGLMTLPQIQPHYVGNYLTYRPLDIWYGQNRANALSRATDRNIMNTSGGNRGTAMAGLIANGYKSQLANGNLFRQGVESNLAQEERKEGFNRGTNIFNAQADMDAQKANASLRQEAGRTGLYGLTSGYKMRDDIDARRQASMNANLTNVLQSLGNIGEEAYDEDRLRWLERTGTLKSRTLSANGGKLKEKKRGLTI